MPILEKVVKNLHNVIRLFYGRKNFVFFLTTLLHHFILTDDFYCKYFSFIFNLTSFNNRAKHSFSKFLHNFIFSFINYFVFNYNVVTLVISLIWMNDFFYILTCYNLFLWFILSEHINVIALIFMIYKILIFVQFSKLRNIHILSRLGLLLMLFLILQIYVIIIVLFIFISKVLNDLFSCILPFYSFLLPTSKSWVIWIYGITHYELWYSAKN